MHPIKITISIVFALFLSLTEAHGQIAKIDSLETRPQTPNGTDAVTPVPLDGEDHESYNRGPLKADSRAEASQRAIARIGYLKGEATSLWIKGLSCQKQNRNEALDCFRKALAIAEAVDDKAGICNYLTAIGDVTRMSGDAGTSSQAYKQAFQTASKMKDKRLILKCQGNLVQNIQTASNPIEAAGRLREMVKLSEELRDTVQLSKAYSNLGLIYYRQGDYPTALKYFLSALHLYEKRNAESSIIASQLYTAGIYHEMFEYDKALEIVQQARQLALQKNDSLQLSICYTNAGNIYLATGKFEPALDSFEKALQITKGNYIIQTLNILMNIGVIHRERKDFGQAKETLDKALALAQRSGRTDYIGWIYSNFGWLNLKREHYRQAAEYAEKALQLSEKNLDFQLQRGCRKQLSDIYAASGDYRKAYRNLEQFKLLNDSLFNSNTTRKIALLESEYQFDKEREVYKLEEAKREFQIQNQRQIILLLAIISLLTLLLAVAIFWWNRLRKKMLRFRIETMKRELDANQKAMAVARLKLIQSSERSAHHIQMLEDIRESAPDGGDAVIRQLISDYKLQANHSNWEEFETLFTKVNATFWEKLGELCPTLTPNERKLCVFLKLNMSNKDIALITFQSEEALKKSRLRLRKKFNLDRSTNLGTFIQDL